MKRISLTCALFCLTLNLFAQELVNGTLNSNCIGNGFTAPSCVSNWFASHGSPFVQGNITKNTWASLSSNNEGIEGIFTHYDFIPGKNYTISFKVKITTTINAVDKILTTANVRATNNLTSNFNTQNSFSTNQSELIWSKSITKNSSNWESITISFTPRKSNSQLWFYTTINNNQNSNPEKYSQFEIDDIVISTSGQKHTVASLKNESNSPLTVTTRDLEYIFPDTVEKNDYVNVRINSGEVDEIQIIDLAGNTFKSDFRVLSKNYLSLQLRKDLYEGNYIVKVIKKDNSTIVQNLTIK
ncbi:hypothetical protein [Flavobacterium sp. J27]|uniref:hypothetical protein n=1 Tax=Flavobacterium sp. J27 TaxID=2060419 RepID=UPI001030F51B|nr:hypothetical protein [Flavobacterium sp. J27]